MAIPRLYRLWHSPLSGRIYVGKITPGGIISGQKNDVTSDFLGCVIEHIGEGNVLTVGASDGDTFEITVRRVKPKDSGTGAG